MNSLWKNPRYSFSNWLKYIPWFFHQLKYSFQRATRGYADPDLWNFNDYIASISYYGLRELATNLHGTPIGKTELQWRDELEDLANCFYPWLKESNPSDELFETYYKTLQTFKEQNPKAKDVELEMLYPQIGATKEMWLRQAKREEEEKRKKIKQGFEKMAELFPDLWD